MHAASLVERARLAVHKQSFFNLLRQNGRPLTKVYCQLSSRSLVVRLTQKWSYIFFFSSAKRELEILLFSVWLSERESGSSTCFPSDVILARAICVQTERSC